MMIGVRLSPYLSLSRLALLFLAEPCHASDFDENMMDVEETLMMHNPLEGLEDASYVRAEDPDTGRIEYTLSPTLDEDGWERAGHGVYEPLEEAFYDAEGNLVSAIRGFSMTFSSSAARRDDPYGEEEEEEDYHVDYDEGEY